MPIVPVNVSASVEVPGTAAAVWEAALDWEAQGRWMPFTEVVIVEGSGDRVGDRLQARTGVRPLAVTDPMTITGWDPPRRAEVRHTGSAVRGIGVFEITPAGDGAVRFTWSEQLPASGWYGALAWAGRRPAQAALAFALRRFARWWASADR